MATKEEIKKVGATLGEGLGKAAKEGLTGVMAQSRQQQLDTQTQAAISVFEQNPNATTMANMSVALAGGPGHQQEAKAALEEVEKYINSDEPDELDQVPVPPETADEAQAREATEAAERARQEAERAQREAAEAAERARKEEEAKQEEEQGPSSAPVPRP